MNYRDQAYMDISFIISKMSKCNRAKVGCLIVKDNNILSYGYNGTPSGSCNDCEDENGKTKNNVLHAESNALMKLCLSGFSSKNATVYCTLSPCLECAKLMKQAGIIKVYYRKKYRDLNGVEFLKKENINVYEI